MPRLCQVICHVSTFPHVVPIPFTAGQDLAGLLLCRQGLSELSGKASIRHVHLWVLLQLGACMSRQDLADKEPK